MLLRSRSTRIAAFALVAATPLVASYAAPSFAVGDDAEVSAKILDNGDVEVTSTKGLSRTTVVLCDGSTVVIPSWSGDQTVGVVDVDGVVRAVFVHSGDNTTLEAEQLLEELAPGAVSGNSTGAIALNDPDACDDTEEPPGDNEEPPGDNEEPPGGNEEPPGGTEDPTEIVDPGPDTPDPSDPVTTTAGPSTNPAVTNVLGVTLERPNPAPAVGGSNLEVLAELPRTGAAHMQFLVSLALSLLTAGLALRAGFGRRMRSASSPG